MRDISSRAVDAKAFVSARLSEMEGALDGFPVAVLLDDWLMIDDRDSVADRRTQRLVAHILPEWATTIERDLQRLPPAAIQVLQTIRQRMVDSRDALLLLRSLLHELSDFAPNRAESDGWLRTSTRRSGSVLSDALNQFEQDAALQGNPRRTASSARWPAMAATQPPVKLWRFAFMARTVMGFVASSFSLGSVHARSADAQGREQPRAEPNDDDQASRLEPPGFAPQVPNLRPADLRQERRRLARDIGTLNIAGPSSWRRRHSTSSKVTECFTHDLRTGIATFVVPPPVDFAGTAEQFQSGLVRRISEGMPVVDGTTRTGAAGSFRFFSCVMKPPWGAPRRMVLYTALWAGKGQVLLFGADCDQLFHDNVLVVHDLVQKIVVPGGPVHAEHASNESR